MPDPTSWDREVNVVGVLKQNMHPKDCRCESCGPLYAIFFSEYEAIRLLSALERRDGRDSGDWHAQIRSKLTVAIGRDNLADLAKYFGVSW